MSAEHGLDVPSMDQTGAANQNQKSGTKEVVPITTATVRPWQIYVIMAYYMAMIIGAVVLLACLILNEDWLLKEDRMRLLATMAFLASGAVIGSILYQIRMLFRYYVKSDKFDVRWLSKYYTAPIEAVGLSLAVMSLIQSGGIMLGGQHFTLGDGKPFAAFGLGALIGFGIREVVGWVGNLTRTMFSADTHRSSE
jgi:hypothetical protein